MSTMCGLLTNSKNTPGINISDLLPYLTHDFKVIVLKPTLIHLEILSFNSIENTGLCSLKCNVEVSSSVDVNQHNSFENLDLIISEGKRKGENKRPAS